MWLYLVFETRRQGIQARIPLTNVALAGWGVDTFGSSPRRSTHWSVPVSFTFHGWGNLACA